MNRHADNGITDATFLCSHCLNGNCDTRPEDCHDLFMVEHFGLVACDHDH